MKYTKLTVMMPVAVEIDENGKVGSATWPSLKDVQAVLDALHTGELDRSLKNRQAK